MSASEAYRLAFLDWLACASAGIGERAPQAVRASGDDLLTAVATAGAAGHVLDYDDTFAAGVAHVSAACAPAALVLAAAVGATIGEALAAYAAAFEAMAACAEASHPALYDGGWHPTAVCGPVGAAVAAGRVLGLDPERVDTAIALSVVRTGGTRGAFGSDAKAIQVGLAAAAGVRSALIAHGGAQIDVERAVRGPVGFEHVTGARLPAPRAPAAIERNWIKLHPSCLGTHAAIEAAASARARGVRPGDRPAIVVDPVSRQAAHLDEVADGLSAKFSIRYCVAHALLHGPPRIGDFARVDPAVADAARSVTVEVSARIPPFGAVLSVGGDELERVDAPTGSPGRPAAGGALAAKIAELAGDRLDGALDDPGAPAARVLEAAGLSAGERASAR